LADLKGEQASIWTVDGCAVVVAWASVARAQASPR